jgi:hypothetical protein
VKIEITKQSAARKCALKMKNFLPKKLKRYGEAILAGISTIPRSTKLRYLFPARSVVNRERP